MMRHEPLGTSEVHSLRHGAQPSQPQIDRHSISNCSHGLAPFRRRTRTSSVDPERNASRGRWPVAVACPSSRDGSRSGRCDHLIAAAAERLRSTFEVGREQPSDPLLPRLARYDWDGRVFRLQVDDTSAKAKRITKLGRAPVWLTIQSEMPPYRYAVYGTATLGPSTDRKLRTRVARRYFGRLAGDQYVAQETAGGRGEASLRVITIEPERVTSHDFGTEAGWFGRLYFRVWRVMNSVPA